MKKILLLIGGILIIFYSYSQFQYSYYADHKHAKDINIAKINDGTNDLIIASNLFDSQSTSHVLNLKRLDISNSVVWSKFYTGGILANARVFDVENYYDFIFVTGYIEDAGVRKVFIAKIEAFSGNVLGSEIFDIPSSSFHSTGFKLLSTTSDANGDGNNNDGLLLTGYFSNCQSLDLNCSLNAGFVLRTDLDLNVFWALEMESIVPGSSFDYDFINGAIETSDGYFLTGSATGENSLGMIRQGVLAHKIDFQGNSVWDASYIFGNSNDVSVDAYYDFIDDEIYMLSNYSNTHQFGVSVFDNATGNMIPSKSWYSNSSNMDYYGFKILRSTSNANNLVITGYIREVFDGTNINETNVFIYEFDRATGNQFGDSYQYELLHQVAISDDYNFWNGQMPLVYYPDISLIKSDAASSNYLTVGYRTNADGFTESELFIANIDKRNACGYNNLNFTIQAQNISPISTVSVGITPYSSATFTLTDNTMPIIEGSCSSPLSINKQDISANAIYPNPVDDYFYIDNTSLRLIEIYDGLGKQITSLQSKSNHNAVFVGDLQEGLYFVKLYFKDNTSVIQKLIKL